MKEIDPANASYDDLFTFVTNMLEVRHQLFVLPTMTEVAFNVPRWDGRAREVALLWRLTKRGNYAEWPARARGNSDDLEDAVSGSGAGPD